MGPYLPQKDEPNHHPHPNTTGRINIGHCANTPFYIDVFAPINALLAYAFTGIGETLTRSIFGSGAVIAFGKRVFLFLAIRSFARDMLTDPLLKLLGKFVLIPMVRFMRWGSWTWSQQGLRRRLYRWGTYPLICYG